LSKNINITNIRYYLSSNYLNTDKILIVCVCFLSPRSLGDYRDIHFVKGEGLFFDCIE